MRISKVRITDHRPGAGKPSPVGRRTAATTGGSMTGLDHLAAIQAREAAEHDRAVAHYSPRLIEAAYNDLMEHETWDRKNPEHRWVLARRAALRRRGMNMREKGQA